MVPSIVEGISIQSWSDDASSTGRKSCGEIDHKVAKVVCIALYEMNLSKRKLKKVGYNYDKKKDQQSVSTECPMEGEKKQQQAGGKYGVRSQREKKAKPRKNLSSQDYLERYVQWYLEKKTNKVDVTSPVFVFV